MSINNEIVVNADDVKPKKYKSIFINGNNIAFPDTQGSNDLHDLDKFLENEKIHNSNEPWSKLDKTAKIRKLTSFAEQYKSEKQLNDKEYSLLLTFFKDCLDRKKLQRIKDVIYNKENGEITEIPALHYNKQTNHFTLKNIDKRVSTVRGLAPKKKQGTIKNSKIDNDSDNEEDT